MNPTFVNQNFTGEPTEDGADESASKNLEENNSTKSGAGSGYPTKSADAVELETLLDSPAEPVVTDPGQSLHSIRATEDRKANILMTSNKMQFLIPMEGDALSVAPLVAVGVPTFAANAAGTVAQERNVTQTLAQPDGDDNNTYDVDSRSNKTLRRDKTLKDLDGQINASAGSDEAAVFAGIAGSHAGIHADGGGGRHHTVRQGPPTTKTGTLQLPLYGNLGVGSPRSPEELPDYTNMADVKHKTIWVEPGSIKHTSNDGGPKRTDRTMSIKSLARFEDVFGEVFGNGVVDEENGNSGGVYAVPVEGDGTDLNGGNGNTHALNYAEPAGGAQVYSSAVDANLAAALPYAMPSENAMEYIPHEVGDDLTSSDGSDYEVIEEYDPAQLQLGTSKKALAQRVLPPTPIVAANTMGQ